MKLKYLATLVPPVIGAVLLASVAPAWIDAGLTELPPLVWLFVGAVVFGAVVVSTTVLVVVRQMELRQREKAR